jgi:hypothetical protein
MSERICECPQPNNILNSVCGDCLLPLSNRRMSGLDPTNIEARMSEHSHKLSGTNVISSGRSHGKNTEVIAKLQSSLTAANAKLADIKILQGVHERNAKRFEKLLEEKTNELEQSKKTANKWIMLHETLKKTNEQVIESFKETHAELAALKEWAENTIDVLEAVIHVDEKSPLTLEQERLGNLAICSPALEAYRAWKESK